MLFSCNDDGVEETNPFVGTWENTENNNVRFIFSEKIATGYIYERGYNNDIYWTGTYTYNDTHLTVIPDQDATVQEVIDSWPNGLIWEYKFENDLLLLYNPALSSFRRITTSK